MHHKVLAVDVGNTTTKIGCFVHGQLEEIESFPTDKKALENYQAELQEGFPADSVVQLDGAVVSTVVPSLRPLLEHLLTQLIPADRILWIEGRQVQQLDCGGVDFSGYTLETLGADRVANVVGACHAYPDRLLAVCDFGTSATFDLVEAGGQFCGGAISPGPLKYQSLVSPNHTAQLFEVDVFQQPAETPGMSTQSCLANGLYYGYKGSVLEIVGNLLQSARWPLSQVTFVFTGGFGSQVRAMLTQEILNVHVDQELTLKGLYRLWMLNMPQVCPVGD